MQFEPLFKTYTAHYLVVPVFEDSAAPEGNALLAHVTVTESTSLSAETVLVLVSVNLTTAVLVSNLSVMYLAFSTLSNR